MAEAIEQATGNGSGMFEHAAVAAGVATAVATITGRPAFEFERADMIRTTRTNWLVRDYVPANGTTVFYGAPGSYKSFATIDIAMSVVTGRPLAGNPVLQGGVVCIIGEGRGGYKRRLAAWAIHHGLSLEGLPIFVSKLPADFADKAITSDVIEGIFEIVRQHGITPRLIVVDTLARNFGGNENDDSEINRFLTALDTVRRQWDCAVIVVHHPGCDQQRMRGASALLGTPDCNGPNDCTAGEMRAIYRPEKMKDDETPKAIGFLCAASVLC